MEWFRHDGDPFDNGEIVSVIEVVWSPRGSQIAIFCFSEKIGDNAGNYWYLCIVDATRGKLEHKVGLTGENSHVVFDNEATYKYPRSGHLVWNHCGTKLAASCILNLYIVDAKTGVIEHQVPKEIQETGIIAWNSAGTKLAHTSTKDTLIVNVASGLVDSEFAHAYLPTSPSCNGHLVVAQLSVSTAARWRRGQVPLVSSTPAAPNVSVLLQRFSTIRRWP